mgnify:CR=1 FL=1
MVSFGIGGVEFFAHPWELGPRKAKELLFTSDWLSAEEAKSLGMVNQIVPRDTLEAAALAMAQKIAKKSLFALKLTKEAVNVAEDAQGARRRCRPRSRSTSSPTRTGSSCTTC